MVVRKLAPTLATGYTALVKTAGETPYTACALAALSTRTGVPEGVINIVSTLRFVYSNAEEILALDRATIRSGPCAGARRTK